MDFSSPSFFISLQLFSYPLWTSSILEEKGQEEKNCLNYVFHGLKLIMKNCALSIFI